MTRASLASLSAVSTTCSRSMRKSSNGCASSGTCACPANAASSEGSVTSTARPDTFASAVNVSGSSLPLCSAIRGSRRRSTNLTELVMPASHSSPSVKRVSMPLTRGAPSLRSVARILWTCALNAACTRAAKSGSSCSRSENDAMRAILYPDADDSAGPASGRGRDGVLGQVPADDHALDLVGALEDLEDLRLAHVPLGGVVTGVARAAQHLDGVRGHLHRRVGGHEL